VAVERFDFLFTHKRSQIMSFQAYLDNIEEKTGKTPNEFIAMAKKRVLTTRRPKQAKSLHGLKKITAWAVVMPWRLFRSSRMAQKSGTNMSGQMESIGMSRIF
jgi:hypothetical protein